LAKLDGQIESLANMKKPRKEDKDTLAKLRKERAALSQAETPGRKVVQNTAGTAVADTNVFANATPEDLAELSKDPEGYWQKFQAKGVLKGVSLAKFKEMLARAKGK
jgi:hypothetical protein